MQALGMDRHQQESRVSRLCEELAEEVELFHTRPLEGSYPLDVAGRDLPQSLPGRVGRWSRWRW